MIEIIGEYGQVIVLGIFSTILISAFGYLATLI